MVAGNNGSWAWQCKGADGRSRGGDKEAEEEEEEGGGGDEADIVPTLTRQIHNKGDVNLSQHGCFEMSRWGSVEVK